MSSYQTIFLGGNVNIARRMHFLAPDARHFQDIEPMSNADLRIVSLMCSVSTVGDAGIDKGSNFFHFRARPEQLNILTAAGIDVVLAANHHSVDYGPEALLEQCRLLDEAGIAHVGSGKNLEEASKPVYVKAGDLTVAIFDVDAVLKSFAADDNRPGNRFIPLDDLEQWQKFFSARIADARQHADLVLVAVNWEVGGANRPSDAMTEVGKILIDCGADTVLGCHSNLIRFVEKYKERPIIYGAGVLLFDAAREINTGAFTLTFDRDGIKKINFIPLRRGFGWVKPANPADAFEIAFEPPPRNFLPPSKIEPAAVERRLLRPLSEPRPEWIVERVPFDAVIRPHSFGDLTLVGYKVDPDCRLISKRKLLFVETFWSIDRPLERNVKLQILGTPLRQCNMGSFGAGMLHEFCDWQFPTERWTPGVIYRERIGLIPPGRTCNIDVRIEIRIDIDGKFSAPFVDPQLISMRLSNTPRYRTQFPDIVFQSTPGKCWTAPQLAAATGGKWLVEPPEGWFIQSIPHHIANIGALKPPRLLLASSRAQMEFHNQRRPPDTDESNHNKIAAHVDRIAGVITDRRIENLPPDFPQLLVDDPIKAGIELGFAARQRFQGKVIGVTGTNGKTTTCSILRHVLEKDHSVDATYGSINTRLGVPMIFANVKQETAFAVIEISINAMHSVRGSITYDIPPHIAVVTAIFEVHLTNSGALEEIADAKSRIFNGMSPGGYAVLNRDMNFYELFERKAKAAKLNIITFGTHPDSTIRMTEIKNGGAFTIDGREYVLECPVPNDQLYDALAVVGVSLAAGVSIEHTLEQLKTYQTVRGRGNLINVVRGEKSLRLIDSTYNANIASIAGALEYLKSLEPKSASRIALLGDVAELGDESVQLHLDLVEPILRAEPDRVLLVGEFMKHVWEALGDGINGAWFPTYKELIAAVDDWVRDGDTVLIKSSHGTHLDHVVRHLVSPVRPPLRITAAEPVTLNVPKALFDVRDFLPEGITPEMNGRMPTELLRQVDGEGYLYIDAARAWNAMFDAAERDGVFFRISNPFSAYRTFETQERVFKKRLKPIGADNPLREGAIRVEYNGEIYQLLERQDYASVPGRSSHGYGLAMDVQNVGVRATHDWLEKNAACFGFKREFDFESWHFTYIGGRDGVPEAVLEFESRPPKKTWTAKEISAASGCRWYGPAPTEDWRCRGLLTDRPLKTNRLAVVDQGDGDGLNENLIGKIFRQCAGLICTRPEELLKYNRPLLVTVDIDDTIARLQNLFDDVNQ